MFTEKTQETLNAPSPPTIQVIEMNMLVFNRIRLTLFLASPRIVVATFHG